MEVEQVARPDAFLEHAGALLLADEARHNLAFGIVATARAHPELYPEFRGWVARTGGEVVGAALRTPPHNVVLVRPTDERALRALAEAIEDDDVAGVVGAVPEIDPFARALAERYDAVLETRFEQGVYALHTVIPARETRGSMRPAERADRALLLDWVEAFTTEVLHESVTGDAGRLERSVDARLAGGDAGFALWEANGRPVSLVGFSGPTPNGIRIGPVYTPPVHRGRGYGSALTAAVSALQLARGRRFCFLYTDLGNPTSNAIYVRIGYERVCDSRELALVHRARG
jgi:predicted GNAT family acetyltransferase